MDNFEFDKALNTFFKSTQGVGSRVTERDEASKRQLTVTQHERALLLKYHQNLPVGSLRDAEERGEQSRFRFRKYPSGRWIDLKLNFPKMGKNELRLYFNEADFSPNANDMWFMFERNNDLWIGSLEDAELEAARNGAQLDLQNGFDQAAEETYQLAVNSNRPELVLNSSLRYRRDARVAALALERSEFKCEMLPDYPTFNSKVTGKPYLEVHHLVPMMEQRHFQTSLDVIDNICVLNPYSHKMLHHAKIDDVAPFVERLAQRRMDYLGRLGVSIDRLLNSYGETIL